MKIITSAYFKYFLVAMLMDCAIILGTFWAFYGIEKLSVQIAFLLFGFWITANLLNYSKSNRRYISFIHTYYESVLPFVFFSVMYLGYLQIYYPNWKVSIPFLRFFGVLFLFILLGKALYVYALRIYRKLGFGFSNYILVGSEMVNKTVSAQFEKRKESGYRLIKALKWEELKDGQLDVEKIILENEIDEVYCFPEKSHEGQLKNLITLADSLQVNAYSIPFDTIKHIAFYNFRRINGSSVKEILNGPLERFQSRLVKRVFDVVFSSLVIIFILSWLLPILIFLIKMDSKGPAFFVQKRAGKFGNDYWCLKLRTMVETADADKKQAVVNDPRITRIGKFLRLTSLDELPQFFNVLVGQMSVVGPRPHIDALNKKFGPEIPNYNDRFNVKPGITGLSQMHGYRGETPTIEIMKQRVDVDRLYVQNWTLLLDIRIVYKTILISLQLKDSNAY